MNGRVCPTDQLASQAASNATPVEAQCLSERECLIMHESFPTSFADVCSSSSGEAAENAAPP